MAKKFRIDFSAYEGPKKQVAAIVPVKMIEEMDREAAIFGVSRSDILRRVWIQFMNNRESLDCEADE